MKCNYCAGTTEECGCDLGYCAHCDKGEVADWPFGITENDLVAVSHAYHAIFEIFMVNPLRPAIKEIGRRFMNVEFSENDVNTLEAFFEHRYRDVTVGTFSSIVGYRAYQIAKAIHNTK